MTIEEQPSPNPDVDPGASYGPHITVADGFRFGCGFMLAFFAALFALVIVILLMFLLGLFAGLPVLPGAH
jgi:hypothetical protein